MFELGKKARDKISGFEGILTGHADYIYGCDQYLISPPVDDKNNAQDGRWYDEGRIEIIGKGIKPEDVKVEENGGPNCDAPLNRC